MPRIEISTTTTINAEADHVWKILGEDFLAVARWATSIDHSTANPLATAGPADAPADGRSCTIAGFGTTDERLVTFDRSSRTMSYSVAAKKIPPFVKGMLNEWSVEPAGNGKALVSSRITADAKGILGAMVAPMMRMKLRKTADEIFTDLRAFAETGTPSQAKQQAVRKAAKKAESVAAART
ncbi:MAG: hypothetical protein FD127_2516 [Acidimicrobiaceae bacterium]|nr:MAG: hypothetical protein FD127_2516 [Acidimicrobiaceae bacterium]